MARRFFAGVAAFCVVLAIGTARADLAINEIDDFESYSVNDHPDGFYDGSNVWVGTSTVVSAPGGGQAAAIEPGAADSYDIGLRNGPYARPGASTSFPAVTSTYSFVVDIYAASSPGSSGSIWWTNAVTNNGTGDYLTETGFAITPGSGTWDFTTTTGGNPVATLTSDMWYTLEVQYDNSGAKVSATHNIYAQGDYGGSPLYSNTLTSLFMDPDSSDLGGPRYSWFTVWDNNAVDSLTIDNFGTVAAVPEAGSMLLVGAVSLLTAGAAWVRRR